MKKIIVSTKSDIKIISQNVITILKENNKLSIPYQSIQFRILKL